MKKKLTKRMLLGVLATAMFGISANDAEAQTFTNTGTGTYNASCGAVIRLKAADATSAITGNSIGTNAANAIPGVVEYSRTTGAQTVQPYYYQHLILSGASTKNVLTGVFILGESCGSFLAGYTSLGTYPYYVDGSAGTVTYNGIFNYAGLTEQNIFPTTYVTLDIAGTGDAVVRATETVIAQNVISAADAPILVNGTLNLTTGASDINGAITVAAGGTLGTGVGVVTIDGALASAGTITTGVGNVTTTSTVDLTGTATLTVAGAGDVALNGVNTTAAGTTIAMTGAGDLTFGGNLTLGGALDADNVAGGLGNVNLDGTTTIQSTGSVALGDATNMIITGGITNEGNGANLAFNCNSNVTYDGGAQTIMPTIASNPYGNLTLSGAGLKTGGRVTAYPDTEESNINICKNFTLNGGNLDMMANSGFLALNDPTITPTYGAGTGTEEVLGKMRRTYATSTDSYVFNNYQTSLTFTTDASAAGYYQFDVVPGSLGAPINVVDAANTVDRKIQMTYDLASWVGTVKAGYLASELPAFSGGMGESNLKFFEADGPNADNIEKLAGSGYTRDVASSFRSLSLSGIEPGVGAVDGAVEKQFTSGHDLVLRANNRMYNIADGRWTNPNSWDEGRVPTDADDVELVYTSYVGIDGPFISTLAAGNTTSEFDHYTDNRAAAKSITIAQKPASASQNPALIIGNEDNPDGYIFRTVAAGTITNSNTTANNAARANWSPLNGSELVVKGTLQIGDIQGIWVTPYVTGAKIPGLGTNSISNAGTVNNQGIIEIGE